MVRNEASQHLVKRAFSFGKQNDAAPIREGVSVNRQTRKTRPVWHMPAGQNSCAENKQKPAEEKNHQHRFHSSNYSSRHARGMGLLGPRLLASPFGELGRSYPMLVPYFQV